MEEQLEHAVPLEIGQSVWIFPPYTDKWYKCRYAGDVDVNLFVPRVDEVYTSDSHVYWFDGDFNMLRDITDWHTEWLFSNIGGGPAIIAMNRQPGYEFSDIQPDDFDNIFT